MRGKSYRNSKNVLTNNIKEVTRGGEHKVMTKKLNILLVMALVFSMLVPAFGFAAEAELTSEQKFEALKEAGVLDGYTDGTSGAEENMKRGELAKILANLYALDVQAGATSDFEESQTSSFYTEGYIQAVVAAGLMQGGVKDGKKTFRPNANVSLEELMIVTARALELELDADATVEGQTSSWSKSEVAAVISAGLFVDRTDYTAAAIRADLFEAAYEVAVYLVAQSALAVKSVSQVGVKKLAVEFNRAVTAEEKAELTFAVKMGFVPYNVSATYNEENTAVTLEAGFNFPAGDYTVEVKGFNAAELKVEDEKVSKIEIEASSLQKATNQDLKVKAYNQYNEVVANTIADSNISVYNATTGAAAFNPVAGKVDLSAAKIDDTFVVTVTHPSTGLSATKTFKLVEKSTIKQMTFGQVTPLKDKVRISISETGLEVPYTLVDQYGLDMKFAEQLAGSNVFGDVTFVSNNDAIVNPTSFAVDNEGKLTFNTGAVAGTAIITAYNSKTGATASFSVKVEALATVKTFQLNHPGVLIAANEAVKFPFASTDSFGAVIDVKEFAKAGVNAQVNITSSNPAVTLVKAYNAKTGELSITFNGVGTTTLYVWVDGQIASQVNLEVKAAATPVRVTAVKDLQTVFANQGSTTVEFANLTVVDNYGRVLTELPAGYDFTVAKKDAAADKVTVAGNVITGSANAGTETIVVGLTNAGAAVANSSFEFTAKSIANEDIKSFELKSVGVLYGNATFTTVGAADNHAKAVTLVGKDANGKEVAINQSSYITSITTSNPSVVGVDFASLKAFGKKAGTATVAVWDGATKLAEMTVEASEAAPVATTVEFANTEFDLAESALDLAAELTIKDQYGVVMSNPATLGTWTSSNTAKATVTAGSVTRAASATAGLVTIAFVSNNGIAKTVTVDVAAE